MANLQLCIQEIKTWLRDNFLLLNEQKTEVVKFGREFTGNHLQIGEASICSSCSSATSLGCTLDSSLNMSLHKKPCALLGGFGGMSPGNFFFKWCNLVRFGVYFDQILSLKDFKKQVLYKNFKN